MTPRERQVLIALGVILVVLLVVLVVVLVIGWGDPPAATTSSVETTSSAEFASTTAPPSTTTSAGTTSSTTSTSTSSTSTSTSTTTTTLPPGACPGAGAGPLPDGAIVLTELSGDFDGDGAQDRFLIYEDTLGTRWARVELAYGYASLGPAPASDLNVRRVNLGGPADLVAMDHLFSSPDRMASFYHLAGCTLAHVYTAEGRPAQFVLRRSDSELAGVTCTAEGIIVTEATTADGIQWAVSSVAYLWNPTAGELQSSLGAAAILHSPEDDAAIQSYGDWNC